MEWEILGDLGLRLNHKEEAKEAYQRCLDSMRFSYKPWLKLLEMYSEEGDLQRSLQAAIRVAAYQYADYGEMTVGFRMVHNGCNLLTYSELLCSIPQPSPAVSSSWVKSTGTKRLRTRSSAWASLTTSGKPWRATYIMGRSSKLRVTISDTARTLVFSSFTLADSLLHRPTVALSLQLTGLIF